MGFLVFEVDEMEVGFFVIYLLKEIFGGRIVFVYFCIEDFLGYYDLLKIRF